MYQPRILNTFFDLNIFYCMIVFEHILLHDRFAKGLGTSSENLERLLLSFYIVYINHAKGRDDTANI